MRSQGFLNGPIHTYTYVDTCTCMGIYILYMGSCTRLIVSARLSQRHHLWCSVKVYLRSRYYVNKINKVATGSAFGAESRASLFLIEKSSGAVSRDMLKNNHPPGVGNK